MEEPLVPFLRLVSFGICVIKATEVIIIVCNQICPCMWEVLLSMNVALALQPGLPKQELCV